MARVLFLVGMSSPTTKLSLGLHRERFLGGSMLEEEGAREEVEEPEVAVGRGVGASIKAVEFSEEELHSSINLRSPRTSKGPPSRPSAPVKQLVIVSIKADSVM